MYNIYTYLFIHVSSLKTITQRHHIFMDVFLSASPSSPWMSHPWCEVLIIGQLPSRTGPGDVTTSCTQNRLGNHDIPTSRIKKK